MTGSILDLSRAVRGGDVGAIDLAEEAFEKAEAKASLHAFITLTRDAALDHAHRVDAMVAAGDDPAWRAFPS